MNGQVFFETARFVGAMGSVRSSVRSAVRDAARTGFIEEGEMDHALREVARVPSPLTTHLEYKAFLDALSGEQRLAATLVAVDVALKRHAHLQLHPRLPDYTGSMIRRSAASQARGRLGRELRATAAAAHDPTHVEHLRAASGWAFFDPRWGIVNARRVTQLPSTALARKFAASGQLSKTIEAGLEDATSIGFVVPLATAKELDRKRSKGFARLRRFEAKR